MNKDLKYYSKNFNPNGITRSKEDEMKILFIETTSHGEFASILDREPITTEEIEMVDMDELTQQLQAA
ncbi:MAG: hypothetical protein ACXQTL_08690 [Methanosarcinales archaeon]